MHRRPQRLAAEFIGTFGVVLFSAGAVCADQFLRGENLPGFGPLGIALAYGFAFGTLVTAVGCVCGGQTICGHLNPAVTLGFWGTRRIGTFDAIACCLAQLAGAAAAGYALRYALPEDTWRAALLGTPAMAAGITRTPAMLIEGAGAFFLVFVMFATSISATALDAKIDTRIDTLDRRRWAQPRRRVGALVRGTLGGTDGHGRRAFQPALHRRLAESRPRLRHRACRPLLDQSWRLLDWPARRRRAGRLDLRCLVSAPSPSAPWSRVYELRERGWRHLRRNTVNLPPVTKRQLRAAIRL